MNSKTQSENKLCPGKYDMVIQIGSIRCAVILRNRACFAEWKQLYGEFITEGPADITIDLEVTNRVNLQALPDVLYNTVFSHNGGRFWTNSSIISGQYDLSRSIINITAEKDLGNTDFEYNHLNRLMAMAYYSGCKVKYNDGTPPAFLLHACGIIQG